MARSKSDKAFDERVAQYSEELRELLTVLIGEFSFGRVSTAPSAAVRSAFIQRTPRPTISFTIVPTTTICSICITICI